MCVCARVCMRVLVRACVLERVRHVIGCSVVGSASRPLSLILMIVACRMPSGFCHVLLLCHAKAEMAYVLCGCGSKKRECVCGCVCGGVCVCVCVGVLLPMCVP